MDLNDHTGTLLRRVQRFARTLEKIRVNGGTETDPSRQPFQGQAAHAPLQAPHVLAALGSHFARQQRFDTAALCYGQAARMRPGMPDILFSQANALSCLGRAEGAVALYRRCLALRPGMTAARYNLGLIFARSGAMQDAADCFRTVLRHDPGHIAARRQLAFALQASNRSDEAAACFAEIVRQCPGNADSHFDLGGAYIEQNEAGQAARHFKTALTLNPDHGDARFAFCRAQLPMLYRRTQDIAAARQRYAAALRDLAGYARDCPGPALPRAAGRHPPFFLAYGGENDRDLQIEYGDLVCGLQEQAHPALDLPAPLPGEKIRVGFVSGYFCQHTIWMLMLDGWLSQLDRERFQLFGYHTGAVQDRYTRQAETLCTRFVCGMGVDWRREILADRPHVLIYPEIGMDPIAAQLATQRLARVQCASWGHPTTSGLRSIDIMLSSAAMEPGDAASHYSEKLVTLPGLGIYCTPPKATEPAERAALGLRRDAVVYWSGQALYKYLPQYDALYPRIARKVPNSQFVFIEHARSPGVTDLLRNRLHAAFAAEGLQADSHCVWLPGLSGEGFIAAAGACDILLDTVGWSGGRSTLEALTHAPALATLEGALMRGRHSAAMLRMMGMTETIAYDFEGYVAIAARLGLDTAWRQAVRAHIRANKHRLFEDKTAVRALEAVLGTCAD